jgi:pyridoxine 4-dehydrogenase
MLRSGVHEESVVLSSDLPQIGSMRIQDDFATISIAGDRKVSRLGFGAMRLTGPPARLDRTTAMTIARRAVELGVTFIDTADSYDLGDNEQLLADALHPYPSDVLIATKGGRINVGDAWFDLGRPEYLRQQAELSLRRLRLDSIELYQLHRVDPTVPLAEQIGALRRLQDEGKVRHVGLSEVSVAQIVEAQTITPIAAVQNRYSVVDRASEDVLEYCERHGIAFIPWQPVARARTGHADRLETIARRRHASRAQLALAWLLHRSPAVLPIPGTASLAHLEDNVAAAGLSLTDADYTELSALART